MACGEVGGIVRRIVRPVLWLLGSILFGIVTKWLDSVPFFGNVFTRMGIWVLIATMIAGYSKTPARAAIHTFLFFLGMLIGYYVYSAYLFGVYSTRDIQYWGMVALLTPFLAIIVWYAKNGGRSTYWLAALPLGLSLSLAISVGIFYFDVTYIEELFMYVALCAMFYTKKKRWIGVVGLSIAVAFLIDVGPWYWYFM